MKVLLIEDDPLLGETLRDFLALHDIEVVWLIDERQLPKTIKNREFDVIILDLILRYARGEDILATLRKAGIKTPVLILTAKNRIQDKEICFSKGADDYITKPFEFNELLLRLKALNRSKIEANEISIADVKINLDAKTIYRGDKEVKISKKAWELLIFLLLNRGEIVDTETILDHLWDDKEVGEEIVRAYIKELRKILPEVTIETHPKRGYRLI